MSLDLNGLTPDDLNALKVMLGLSTETEPFGRSPLKPRQLTDLRILPKADDPRPTFFFSAEPPRHGVDLTRTTPYPRLMWHSTSGEEITVANAKAEATYTTQGFVLTCPGNAAAPDPAEQVREMLASLSPEDRKTVLMAAHASKLEKVQAMAADLTREELDALMASLEPKRKSA